jgi:hypothetical protein
MRTKEDWSNNWHIYKILKTNITKKYYKPQTTKKKQSISQKDKKYCSKSTKFKTKFNSLTSKSIIFSKVLGC